MMPDAYERLLLDAINGDASLFTRSDGIEASWRIIDEVIAGWEDHNVSDPFFYEPGSWGPKEADDLLQKDGRQWIWGCRH